MNTSPTSIRATNSIQGENQTIFATYNSSFNTMTYSSSSATPTWTVSSSTSTAASQSQSDGGSFTYTSSDQMKVLSVAAAVSVEGSGDSIVRFVVQFQNVGSAPIYVTSGGGSGLTLNLTSGASLVKTMPSPRCEIAVALGPLSPGANATESMPGCWSGYYYQLVQAGTIGVHMTLAWSNGTVGGGGGSLQINAEISLGLG